MVVRTRSRNGSSRCWMERFDLVSVWQNQRWRPAMQPTSPARSVERGRGLSSMAGSGGAVERGIQGARSPSLWGSRILRWEWSSMTLITHFSIKMLSVFSLSLSLPPTYTTGWSSPSACYDPGSHGYSRGEEDPPTHSIWIHWRSTRPSGGGVQQCQSSSH